MPGTIVIDCFPESVQRYKNGYAVVAIDVIRASTTIATAVSKRQRVFPVQTTDEAFILASTLENPILVGELGGNIPYGFDLTNSPVEVEELKESHRPMVFISSSGSQVLRNSVGCEGVYVACLRNYTAVSDYLSRHHEHVALIGAGTRGQFRREDQMGCARLAEKLIEAGFETENLLTAGYIARWKGIPSSSIRGGRSSEYLIKTNQQKDLDFIENHVDDLDVVPCLRKGEIIDASQIPEKAIA